MSQRSRVIQLYKNLQYLGREYPVNPEKFRVTCKKVFKNNSKETNSETIEEMIAKGEKVLSVMSLNFLDLFGFRRICREGNRNIIRAEEVPSDEEALL